MPRFSIRRAVAAPFLAVLIGALSAPAAAHEPLPFETIDMGAFSGIEYGNPDFPGFGIAIDDEETWQWFWAEHTSLFGRPGPVPQVDFENETVIAFLQGFRPTSGYSCEIVAIVTRIWGVAVLVELVEDGGPLEVITNPFHIVRAPKIVDRVEFFTYVKP